MGGHLNALLKERGVLDVTAVADGAGRIWVRGPAKGSLRCWMLGAVKHDPPLWRPKVEQIAYQLTPKRPLGQDGDHQQGGDPV